MIQLTQELSTRVALLEQSDERNAKDFKELKEQNAKEHEETTKQINIGFNAQASAFKEYGEKVEQRFERQDGRIKKVEDKQKTIALKTKLIWGGIIFLGTAIGGVIIKWGIPALIERLI